MKKIAIVGAGPSGLVTLKYLLTSHHFLGNEPVEVKLFEVEDGVGGTFYARMYENGEVCTLLVPYPAIHRARHADCSFPAACLLQAAHLLL